MVEVSLTRMTEWMLPEHREKVTTRRMPARLVGGSGRIWRGARLRAAAAGDAQR